MWCRPFLATSRPYIVYPSPPIRMRSPPSLSTHRNLVSSLPCNLYKCSISHPYLHVSLGIWLHAHLQQLLCGLVHSYCLWECVFVVPTPCRNVVSSIPTTSGNVFSPFLLPVVIWSRASLLSACRNLVSSVPSTGWNVVSPIPYYLSRPSLLPVGVVSPIPTPFVAPIPTTFWNVVSSISTLKRNVVPPIPITC